MSVPQWLIDHLDKYLETEDECPIVLIYGNGWLSANLEVLQHGTRAMDTMARTSSLLEPGVVLVVADTRPLQASLSRLSERLSFKPVVVGDNGQPVRESSD